MDLCHLRGRVRRHRRAADDLPDLQRRPAVRPALRSALDHAGRSAGGRSSRHAERGRARAVRHRHQARGGHRATRPAGPDRRRQPALGHQRLSRRRPRRPGRGGGRGGRDRRQPPAHVRRPGRLVAPVRRRAGLRQHRRSGVAAAGRPGDPALARAHRGAARGHPAPDRRPLPGQRGRPLHRPRRPGRAAQRRHRRRHARRALGLVHAQLPEQGAAVRRGGGEGGRPGAGPGLRPAVRQLRRPGGRRRPEPGCVARPTATSPGCAATSTT